MDFAYILKQCWSNSECLSQSHRKKLLELPYIEYSGLQWREMCGTMDREVNNIHLDWESQCLSNGPPQHKHEHTISSTASHQCLWDSQAMSLAVSPHSKTLHHSFLSQIYPLKMKLYHQHYTFFSPKDIKRKPLNSYLCQIFISRSRPFSHKGKMIHCGRVQEIVTTICTDVKLIPS